MRRAVRGPRVLGEAVGTESWPLSFFFFLCIPCLTYGFVFYSLLLYPRKKWIRKGKINEAEYWGERVFAASHASRVAGIKCRKNLVR